MPRKGVPYGDAVCSLKERIAELEQRMASLVNTINHIAANSGDISIGADAPLNVTNDATAHKITVGVSKDNTPIKDSSALVTSGGVKAAIDSEATARQNADTALQANINAVQGALQADYVKKAGADQTVTSRIMVPTTAAGTRDTQIANGTRIQNDLGAYEYMVRTTGNQRPIIGIKACAMVGNNFVEIDGFTTSKAGWHKIYTIKSTQRWIGVLSVFKNSNNYLLGRATMYEYLIVINSTAVAGIYYVTRVGNEPQVRLTFDGTVWNVWVNCPKYQRTYMQLDSKAYFWGEFDAAYHVDPEYETVTTEPAPEDYSMYETPVTP